MRVLLTAFEPYDDWTENSSWMALAELLKSRPATVELITRRYPVDLEKLRERLHQDLQKNPDIVLHLGQSPGTAAIKLEAIAVNVAGCVDEHGRALPAIVDSGTVAYQSSMPLERWVEKLRGSGIPTIVSYHAGTYLCNATMYLSHYWCQTRSERTRIGLVHLPLATEQIAGSGRSLPSLPVATLAQALRLIIEDLSAPVSVDERIA